MTLKLKNSVHLILKKNLKTKLQHKVVPIKNNSNKLLMPMIFKFIPLKKFAELMKSLISNNQLKSRHP